MALVNTDKGLTLIPEQMYYKSVEFASSKLKYSRIIPLSGSQSVTIPASSTAEVLIEWPTNVHNASRSYLYMNLQYPAQGTSTYTWYYMIGCPFLTELDFMSRSGLYIIQLPYCQPAMNMLALINTPLKEYFSSDSSSFLSMCLGTNEGNSTNVTPNNGASSYSYIEPIYLGVGGSNAAVNVVINYPLSRFKKTWFAVDKLMVWPDIMVMRMLFGPANRMCFGSASGSDPTSSAAANTGTVSVTNLTLFLACEKNEDLANAVRQQVAMGMDLLIPYVNVYKQNLGAATSQNLSVRLNRTHGVSLLEIYAAPFNNTETSNTAYDHFNMATPSTAAYNASSAKVTSFNTYLDTIRLQDILVQCGNLYQDDWREFAPLAFDSVIFNAGVYQNNWIILDRMYTEPGELNLVPRYNKNAGLSLLVERQWQLQATTSNTAYNWYIVVVTLKALHVSNNLLQYQ